MNLHGIASAAVGVVNPQVPVSIQRSTGYTIAPDGRQIPSYADPVTVLAQVQPLGTGDLRHVESLNIQGVMKAIYTPGRLDAVVREEEKGGDLVTLQDGSVWLVTSVLEQWPDWVKAVIVLQETT